MGLDLTLKETKEGKVQWILWEQEVLLLTLNINITLKLLREQRVVL